MRPGLLVARKCGTLAWMLLAMLLGVLAAGTGSAAAQGTIITRGSTINAVAEASLCTPDGVCGFATLHVSPDKEGTTLMVCVAISSEIAEEGCADVSATFAIDSEALEWATLAPTTVQLHTWVCDESKVCDIVPTRTITLEAAWSATGELERVRQTLGDPHGPCTVTDKIDGFVRDQTVTIAIDGASVQTTGNLQVLDWKTARRTTCG